MPTDAAPRTSYLMPSFENATVADVMRRGVISCGPQTWLIDVAQMMATHHIHSVVVAGISAPQVVWGVISDMDLARAAREGLEGRTAEEIVREPPVTVPPSTSLDDAVSVMEQEGVTHLLVVDGGQPLGVVSTLDVAGALAGGGA